MTSPISFDYDNCQENKMSEETQSVNVETPDGIMIVSSRSGPNAIVIKNPRHVPRVGELVIFTCSAQRVVTKVVHDYRTNDIHITCD